VIGEFWVNSQEQGISRNMEKTADGHGCVASESLQFWRADALQ